MPDAYDEIVSLGRSCQTAYQLRRHLGVDRAQVFDWIVTGDPGLLSHIETNLTGFFSLETLITDAKGIVRDARTNTSFPHDFPPGADFATTHANHAPRFAALVQRWQELMASDHRVLFIRQHGWTRQPLLSADRLVQTLRSAAPRLPFRLLYLTAPDLFQPAPDRPDLLHRPLPQPDPPDWHGLDAPWQAHLVDALRQPPPNPDGSAGLRPAFP
jgi:hypothetical protein